MVDLLALISIVLLLSYMAAVVLVEAATRLLAQSWSIEKLNITSLALLTSLPWLVSGSVALGILTVFVGKNIGWLNDHCSAHGIGHPHLCITHLSTQQLSWLSSLILVVFGAIVLTRVAIYSVRFVRRQRLARSITRIEPAACVWINSPNLFAYVYGVVTPRVFLSTALKQLKKSAQRIVLAHEVQHIRNYDPLKMYGIEFLLLPFSSATRARLRFAWANKRELRVDAVVAQKFGRVQVAKTLLTMARAQNQQLAVNHNQGSLELRITELLHGHNPLKAHTKAWLLLCGLIICTTVVVEHHSLETIIGWINSW